jgi:uncharacterized protein (DUF1501 family)
MRRPTPQQSELTRRELIRRASCAAVATAAVTSCVRDLRLINAAAADALPAPATDFKALVCIFLSGGNDSNNLLIPIENTTTGYQQYAANRSVIALPLTAFTAANTLTPLIGDGHTYGIHPSCPEMATLFNTGKLAFVLNVGTLLYPLSRAQYLAKSIPFPPQLFSHNDQVIQWQTSIPDRDSRTGWAGRLADLTNSMNSANTVSMSISIAGVNTLEVGDVVNEYNISTSGPQGLSTSSTEVNNLNTALKGINNYSLTPASASFPQTNLYEVAYAASSKRAVDNFAAMNSALHPTDEKTVAQGGSAWVWQTPFPATSLGNELKMVARCIAGRTTLGHQRQIFFVSTGTYDTHTSQYGVTDPNHPEYLTDTTKGTHANLLSDLSKCINAFQAAMTQLRASAAPMQLGTGDAVTGFTASDFGRTCITNGGGTDHGWGSHHIVFGDQVKGQQTYGAFPNLNINTGDDATNAGRWVPKISVDEYSATLAKWFGVPPSNLNLIFPNLSHFANPDVGFMAGAAPATVPLASGGVITISSPESLAQASSASAHPKPAPAKAPAKPVSINRPAMRKSS